MLPLDQTLVSSLIYFMDIEALFKNLERYTMISSALKAYLRIAFKEITLEDNERLDPFMRITNPLVFVRRGILKTKLESKLDPGRKLFSFHFEGMLLPFLVEKNTEDFSLDTYSINETTLLLLSEGHTRNLYKVFPEFEQLITAINGEMASELLHQVFDLHHLKGEERLEKLLQKHPDLFTIATVTDIAASIGMHANTLSALKNRQKSKKTQSPPKNLTTI